MNFSYVNVSPPKIPKAIIEQVEIYDYKPLRITMAQSGKKILFLLDRTARELNNDWQGHKPAALFHEEHEIVLHNMLRQVQKQSDAEIKECLFVNLPTFYAHDKHLFAANKYLFIERALTIIEKYQPDCIVVCGVQAFVDFMQATTEHKNKRWIKGHVGRVLPWSHKDSGLQAQVVGTLSVHQLASQQSDEMAVFPNLIGFWIDSIVCAFDGKNRYTVDVSNSKFIYIDTIEKFDKFYAKLVLAEIIAMDTEGRSLARVTNTLYSIQFTFDGIKAYFLPLYHPKTPFRNSELTYIAEKLRHYYERNTTAKFHIWHNANFDITILKIPTMSLGVRHYQARIFDTIASTFSLQENNKFLSKAGISEKGQGPYSLDFLTTQFGCDIYYHIAFSKADRGNMVTTQLNDALIAYACYDVLVIFQIAAFQRQEAKRRGYKFFMHLMLYQFSNMIKAFSTAEYNGVLIDRKHLFHLMSRQSPIKTMLRKVEQDMKNDPDYQRANFKVMKAQNLPTGSGLFGKQPWAFNVKKAQHKLTLFFDVLNITPLSMNKSGKAGKIDKKLQEAHKDKPAVALFTLHSKLSTLLNTFIGDAKKGLYGITLKDPDTRVDSRLRPRFDYKDVVTGRTCLAAGTRIHMFDRDDEFYKPIEKLCPGDWVWAHNDENERVPVQVTWAGATALTNTVKLTLENQSGMLTTLVCSEEHQFRLTSGVYIPAYGLTRKHYVLGEQIDAVRKTWWKVISIVNGPPQQLYDITVSKFSNFVANGVCVHNSARDPNLQNISQHDALAKHLKRLFIAAIGHLLVDYDFAAHEVRMWANIAGDRDLANSFKVGMKPKLKFRLNPSSKLKAEVEEKGDIHKLNHKHFYGRFPANKKERNGIKSVVFSTIYGKTAQGLAVALDITEEEAQALIDLLFVKFKKGGQFLLSTCKRAARTFTAVSPIGRVRHLYGYMHNRRGVVNAMDRRAPNSVIQGMSSDILQYAATCLTDMIWHFFVKYDVPFFSNHPGHPAGPNNYVHDSSKSDMPVHLIPVYMYLAEHSATTQVHKGYRKIYGFKMLVGLEVDFSLGASADRMVDWDYNIDCYDVYKTVTDKEGNQTQERVPCLIEIIEGLLKEAAAIYPEHWTEKQIKRSIKLFTHNMMIIKDIRNAEIKETLKLDRNPSEIMHMKEDNARSYGLIFEADANLPTTRGIGLKVGVK